MNEAITQEEFEKKVYELTENGFMKAVNGDTEIDHIPNWYKWQIKNVKEEVIGIQVKHASTFNFEVQLNECDLPYTQGSSLKVELYTLNNKSVFKKEFETATIFNTDTNKLNLTFSQEESKTLNKESYKMSLKLCKENDFIEIFAPTDGFLIIR
jgi:hypothetical protein